MLASRVFNVKSLLIAILLTCSVETVEFDCIFQTYYPAIVGDRYTCNAIVTDSGSTSLESVRGVHQTGKTNDDVGYLYINQQSLPFVPGGIADFFKNLDVLVIQQSSLASISASDLQPFPRLLFLYLIGNQLTSLDGDLFKYTPLLQYANFNSNQIQRIGHDLVTNLNNLMVMNFYENVCIQQGASTRDEVLLLAPQLSILCPPSETTTENPGNECLCEEEIKKLRESNRALGVQIGNLQWSVDELHEENQKQREEIERLNQKNAAFEGRLLEVEMQLREIGSLPRII